MAGVFDLESTFEELAEKVREINHVANFERIRDAFNCAVAAHEGQYRRDGTPYVSHPIAAAEIVIEMGLDEDSIIAALLHDAIEDTELQYADVQKRFGTQVADIVDGVTKLTRVQYTSKEDEQMENLRKMLMAMAKDIRVILIKIADRLHNMRTMAYQSDEKQRSKSMETMQIYAPIAHRLGMQKIKWELEDLSLQYLDPEGYSDITKVLDSKREYLETFMTMIELKIRERLRENGMEGMIYGRIKHIYSIYRKMYAQKRNLNEIFDLCAFRVIVDDNESCYHVLGHIHDMFNPIPERFKDYIGTPKPNMYQSIHTTVIGSEGIPFEVQIRTWEMHQIAEYGVAAHWKYKSGESGVKAGDEEKFAWIRRLLENQQDTDDAQDFFQDLQVDMFADEVFVFSPRGDIVALPAGATPIDFAYSIHSAIGNSMTGAKINGSIAPIGKILQNGDVVEIITSKSATPSRDWMQMAKSGQARSKIKQWLKKERREENVLHGRAMFESELRHNGLTMAAVTSEEVLPHVLKRIAVSGLDDMYAAIGYGGLTATRCVNRIKDEIAKAARPAPKTALDKINEQTERNRKHEEKGVDGVLISGMDNCLVKFSRCCTPVPGDSVIGFITRGFGVSVHRDDCANYRNSVMLPDEKGRWIDVQWVTMPTEDYSTTLLIQARDRNNLIMDIATVLNSLSAKVRTLTARDIGSDKASATVTLEVRDVEELRQVIARLQTIAGVNEVLRAGV